MSPAVCPPDELRADRAALAELVAASRAKRSHPMGDWDAAGEFRAPCTGAGELGLLGLGYPEALGGTPAPYALRLVMWRPCAGMAAAAACWPACCRTTSVCRPCWRWQRRCARR
jgi:alkylation response protein AidB-like acyl-CoA dehydrogenase